MRAPLRRRSKPRSIAPAPPGVVLADVAARVRYVGSAEHKDTPTFAGQPRPRADASLCPSDAPRDQEHITGWLQQAIKAGNVGGAWEGGFPRHVWLRVGQTVFEGRLTNRTRGEYKGFPLEPHEWPEGLAPHE